MRLLLNYLFLFTCLPFFSEPELKLIFIFLSYLSVSPDFPSQSIMINNSIPCCFLLFFCDFLNNFSGLFLNFCSLFRFHVKDVASSSCKKIDWSEFENVYLLLLVLRKFKKVFLDFELQENVMLFILRFCFFSSFFLINVLWSFFFISAQLL